MWSTSEESCLNPSGEKGFLFVSEASRPTLVSTQPAIQEYRWLFAGVKTSKPEAHLSLPPNASVKNLWFFTSTLRCALELHLLMHKIFSICVVATVVYKSYPFCRVHNVIWTPYLPLVLLFPVRISASGSPIVGAFAELRKAVASSCLSARPPGTTRLSILIKIELDATVCRYLFTAKLLYMFRVSQHPSSGVLKTVTAASGTGHSLSGHVGGKYLYRYYDLYRRLLLQFSILLMMGAVTPETCRVALQ